MATSIASRRTAQACRERVDFMSIVALDKKRRAERIRKAKAELEAEAKAAAEAKLKAAAEAQQQREAEGRKKPGRPAAAPSTTPEPKAQIHRSGESDHEEQGRIRAGLQRSDCGGRHCADYRRSGRDAERRRSQCLSL
jgi:hypothetical protein